MRASAAAVLVLLVLLGGCTLEFDKSLLGPFDCTGIDFELPRAVLEVSSASAENSPSLSSDELTLYFGSDRPGGVGGGDLYMARRQDKTAPFDAPVNLTAINTPESEGGPSISANGLRLYFHRDQPLDGPRVLMVAERASVDVDFTMATLIPLAIVPAASPDISADELTLYFNSQDGSGNIDIWSIQRDEIGGQWSPPANLSSVNTTSSTEASASIDARGRTLYLHGNATDAVASDVLVATRADSRDPFGTAAKENIASNMGEGEYDPDISYDGTALALLLNRGGGLGSGDIWIATRECPPIE